MCLRLFPLWSFVHSLYVHIKYTYHFDAQCRVLYVWKYIDRDTLFDTSYFCHAVSSCDQQAWNQEVSCVFCCIDEHFCI